MSEIVCKVAEDDAEIEGHFAVRHAIFVEEQGIFTASDRDEHDHDADVVLFVALDTASVEVVGAARCYRETDGNWYAGCLSIMGEYRDGTGSFGKRLCREAAKTMAARGVKRLLAYVQEANITFFERMNWSRIGEPIMLYGRPHQVMEVRL